jgi:hypothetical protein
MIEESIAKTLINRQRPYNFAGLLSMMESSGIEFKSKGLRGPVGMASLDCIYLDLSKLDRLADNFVFYIVLHEMAHLKRIQKMGKLAMLAKLSADNFNVYFNHIITEEIIADRYASLMFYGLNKELFPVEMTQQLHLPEIQAKYQFVVRSNFGVYKNDMAIYEEAIKKYIID